MNKSLFVVAMALVVPVVLQGCAHNKVEEKKVTQDVSQENAVNSRSELRTEAKKVIETAPGLSDDQRKQLLDLKQSVSFQVDQLREESLKLRAVLVKDLISTNYDEDEAETIKGKLRKIEDKRLSLVFKAVDEANNIMGRQKSEAVLHNVIDFEGRVP